MSRFRSLSRCIAAVVVAVCAVPTIAADIDEILSRARAAAGGPALETIEGIIEAKGTAHALGVDGEYRILFTGAGEYLETFASKLPSISGFDGKIGWQTDWSSATRMLELEDLEVSRAILSLVTSLWTTKNSPLKFSLVEVLDDRITLRLEYIGGELTGTLTLDKTNHLPAEFVRKSAAGDDVWKFSQYIKNLQIAMPSLIQNTSGGQTNTFRIDKLERGPVFIRNPFEMPTGPIPHTKYDTSAMAVTESRRAFSGHMLVKPKVNDKDIGWFILDSGAGALCIDPKVADREGMKKVGEIPAVGVGGVVLAPMRTGDSITVGQVTWTNPVFVQLDLEQIGRLFGVELAGILGYDLMARAVVELDTAQNHVAVYSPASYTLSSGTWTKLHLDGKHPVVEAKFEGDRKGLFRLDTGANNTLTFHTQWVERYDLLKDRETMRTMLAGVGGMFEARQGRIEWFELVGHRFENPSVTFATTKTGPLAEAYTVGNIGQGFLRPFKLVFDYQNRRMAFVKRED